METYRYTGSYLDIIVKEPLGPEGILTGSYGDLHFKRCADGFAIIDSSFLGSGFVDWPTSKNVGFPRFINCVPVTEIHQNFLIDSRLPIVITAPELKRAYLRISRSSFEDQIREVGDTFRALFLLMLRDHENVNQEESLLDMSLDFITNSGSVEYCEIQCDERCVLHNISAKILRVKAPTVVLNGHAYSGLERAEFSGKVYPFVHTDWYGDYYDTDYFSQVKSLKMVDGSLRGDDCWRFTGCVSLETVHLANGIKRILPHSFENCSSLLDLYIPDTVTEIGEYAFCGCSNLKSIHLPSSIKVISKGMFKECKSLVKCFLSDEIEVIEDEAFKGCSTMKKPWIPKKIIKISETAFDNPEWRKMS